MTNNRRPTSGNSLFCFFFLRNSKNNNLAKADKQNNEKSLWYKLQVNLGMAKEGFEKKYGRQKRNLFCSLSPLPSFACSAQIVL